MDEEGIDVAVLYPSRGLFALTVPDLDPRLAAAIARAMPGALPLARLCRRMRARPRPRYTGRDWRVCDGAAPSGASQRARACPPGFGGWARGVWGGRAGTRA